MTILDHHNVGYAKQDLRKKDNMNSLHQDWCTPSKANTARPWGEAASGNEQRYGRRQTKLNVPLSITTTEQRVAGAQGRIEERAGASDENWSSKAMPSLLWKVNGGGGERKCLLDQS